MDKDPGRARALLGKELELDRVFSLREAPVGDGTSFERARLKRSSREKTHRAVVEASTECDHDEQSDDSRE